MRGALSRSSNVATRSIVATTALSLAAALGAAAGCGSSPPPHAVEAAKPHASGASFDPCAGKPPPSKTYTGILKNARCEQDVYLTMADVAKSLGVKCGYCHFQSKPDDPGSAEFPRMTEKKQTALFMQHTFVEGLKQKDGNPVECRSCHVDKKGQPAAKFLGEPRDVAYAVEWMNVVMVNKFTQLDGSKLKCVDCHVGNFGTPDFHPKVKLQGDQIKLQGVTPFVPPPLDGPTARETASISAFLADD